MRAHPSTVTAAAALLLGLAACAPDEAFDAPVGESTLAMHLCPDGEYPPCAPDPEGDPPPPAPSAPPRDPSKPRHAGLSTLRIETYVLNAVLADKLRGTYLSIDASKTAPYVVAGSEQACHREGGQAAYQEALAECQLMKGPGRIACAREVEATFPLVCPAVGSAYYSYIAFPPALKSQFPDIKDEVFDLEPFTRDTWFGQIEITIHQIRSVIGQQALTFYTGGGPNPAFLGMYLDVASGSPTAICHNQDSTPPFPPCPDVNLNGMKLRIAMTGLRPDPNDASRVSFSDAYVDFDFTRDINNVPDWFVDVFYDLDWLIKSKVTRKLHDAIMARQAGLSTMLTSVVNEYQRVDGSHPPKIGTIDEIMADDQNLYVHYVPAP